MRVKARAVIWIDGRLILAEQSRRGQRELSLPGGRVNKHESLIDGLQREVAEETGLDVTPDRLLYVSESVELLRTYLELIFLARPNGVPKLHRGLKTINLDVERPAVRPPILGQIASDARAGWRGTPKWLGSPNRGSV